MQCVGGTLATGVPRGSALMGRSRITTDESSRGVVESAPPVLTTPALAAVLTTYPVARTPIFGFPTIHLQFRPSFARLRATSGCSEEKPFPWSELGETWPNGGSENPKLGLLGLGGEGDEGRRGAESRPYVGRDASVLLRTGHAGGRRRPQWC